MDELIRGNRKVTDMTLNTGQKQYDTQTINQDVTRKYCDLHLYNALSVYFVQFEFYHLFTVFK